MVGGDSIRREQILRSIELNKGLIGVRQEKLGKGFNDDLVKAQINRLQDRIKELEGELATMEEAHTQEPLQTKERETKVEKKEAEAVGDIAGELKKQGKQKNKNKSTRFSGLRDRYHNWKGGVGQYKEAPCAVLILLSVVLYIVDWLWFGFNGLNINIFLKRVSFGIISVQVPSFKGYDWIGMLANPIIIAYVVFYLLTHRPVANLKGFFSRMVLVWVCSSIIFMGGLSGSGLLHLGFAFLLYFWLLRPMYEDDIPRAERITSALLFIDFFGYGLVYSYFSGNAVVLQYLSNRFIVPVWFLYTVYKCYEATGKKWVSVLLFVIVFTYVFYFGYIGVQVYNLSTTVSEVQREEAREFIGTARDNLKNWVTQLFTDIKTSATQQLEYATGGYYNGEVEENEDPNNQLGVYLENIEAADKSFYENEQVVIWGDLKARTLDQPIYVRMSCESDGVEGKIVPESLANPENGYKIEQLEQIGFECRFDPGLLKTGSNSIKITAEFNFETLAFLKTYFMDIERIRALRRENIDPLTQYGIKEKRPTAVFTNGPVKLGIGTVDPPVGVNAEENAYSYIGVTVERQWLGKIKNITEITIQVPAVLQLESYTGDLFCRGDFKKTGENEEGYIVYTLTEDSIKKIRTPITDFRSWRCSITVPKASEVLGKTPVTPYYYRANTKYIYEVEKPINVYIKSVPKEKTKITDCNVNCTDSDGCVCNADGCNIAKDSEFGYGYTCNNYFGGCSNKGRTIEQDLGYIDTLQQYIGAMITLNRLCIQGDTKTINESIDISRDLDEKKKKELKDVVLEGCEKRSYRFFEITEDLIVKRASCGVDIFKVLKNKKLEEKKGDVKIKKEEFDALLGTVIGHFNENYGYVATGKSNENIKKIEEKREELKNINFG